MLWLWLNTAYRNTLERQLNNGNLQIGKVGALAADSLYNTVTMMQLEFPQFTYGSQFNITYADLVANNAMTCNDFYLTTCGFPQL